MTDGFFELRYRCIDSLDHFLEIHIWEHQAEVHRAIRANEYLKNEKTFEQLI